MNNNSYFPTEGILIIEMPGRGMRTQRVSKSGRKAGNKSGKAVFNTIACNNENPIDLRNTKSVMRYHQELAREIEGVPSKCHQIVKVTEELANWWAVNNHRDTEYWDKKPNPATYELGIPRTDIRQQNFNHNMREHFMYICEQAFINPGRCSYKFETI